MELQVPSQNPNMMHIAHQPLGLPVHDTRLLAQSMYTQPQPGYHTGHRHADNYEQSQMHRSAAIPPGVYAMEAARHGSQTTSHPEQSYYSGSSTMHLNDGRRVNDTSNRGYVTSTSRDVHLQQAPRIESSSISRSEVWKAFPLDNDDHKAKREALYAIMQSSWKQNNDFEPEASVLMQFMEWDPIEKRWHCKFWKGGKRCTCSCRKRDHGKGHIRSHLDLLPFVCDSQWYVPLYSIVREALTLRLAVHIVLMVAGNVIQPSNLCRSTVKGRRIAIIGT